MTLCEHFIYTSANLEEKRGYQIVSKSAGITNKITTELENYLYPTGTNLSEFNQSKSFLVLHDIIAFTLVRNIGIGPDGRPDTFYNHTILMDLKDFKKFNNDTRIFDKYYLEKVDERSLIPISVEPIKLKPDFSCIDEIGIVLVEYFLRSILSSEKAAIIEFKSDKLIQSLLSLLPPSLRLNSFSTLVSEPERQSKYRIIQTQRRLRSELSSFAIIEPKDSYKIPKTKNTLFEKSLSYLIEIIDTKDSAKLLEIHQHFEEIAEGSIEDKISLVISAFQMDTNPKYFPVKTHLKELLDILERSDGLTASKYIVKMERFMDQYEAQTYAKKFELSRIISHYHKDIIDVDVIEKMFNEMSDGTPESRNYLFHEFVGKRKSDFLKASSKILIDSIFKFYYKDIIRGFIENPKLHSSFDQVFHKNSVLDSKKQQELFSTSVKLSLCHYPSFLKKLFSFDIFDLEKEEDSQSFKEIVRWLFTAREFHNDLEPKGIFLISQKIFKTVDPFFPRNKKSGTINQNLYDIQGIFYILLNTFRYLLTMRKLGLNSLRNEIQEMESNLTHFLTLNRLHERTFFKIPSFDIGYPFPSIVVWTLFSSFSRKCKNYDRMLHEH